MNIFGFQYSGKNSQSAKRGLFLTGFTLMEVIVAATLGIMILIGVFQALNSGQTAWLTGQGSVELRLEIIKALTRMDGEIRGTAPSQINLVGGGHTSTLIFHLPQSANGTVLNSADHIVWSTPVQYSFNNATGQIIRTFSGVNSVLANNITALQFTEDSNSADILYVDITAAKMANNRRMMSDSGHIEIKMRNI